MPPMNSMMKINNPQNKNKRDKTGFRLASS